MEVYYKDWQIVMWLKKKKSCGQGDQHSEGSEYFSRGTKYKTIGCVDFGYCVSKREPE